MNYCTCCGSDIPGGQRVCSMCYGDVGYGSDGHYERWAREQLDRQTRDEHKPQPDETEEGR